MLMFKSRTVITFQVSTTKICESEKYNLINYITVMYIIEMKLQYNNNYNI